MILVFIFGVFAIISIILFIFINSTIKINIKNLKIGKYVNKKRAISSNF